MSYVEWGDPHNDRVLVCVHGLTRNARDFDFLAQALTDRYRVVCPDVVGRGHSDWLNVKTDYAIPLYAADMYALIAQLGIKSVDWVGTSMGGLIGIALASQPLSPIKRMVLNDVGPVIEGQSLARIGQYVGRAPEFATFADAEAYVRAVSASFGNLTDTQWKHITEHSLRQSDKGFVMSYDPGIGDAFRLTPVEADITLWPLYDAIKCPVLVMRGKESDLLKASTVEEMTRRGPHARAVEIAGVGHAPMLMDAEQIGIVKEFLLES
ncbi:MAG TPA: alpha/beta hydrolase [Rhodocyclaceae bacterium]|nr:alpha/beta hydrolase [Rhodocyclaceae bacterium]